MHRLNVRMALKFIRNPDEPAGIAYEKGTSAAGSDRPRNARPARRRGKKPLQI